MTPKEAIDYLQALERKLGSSRVRAFFRDQTPATQNKYALMRGEVTFLLGELTVNRLTLIADRLESHSDALDARSARLKEELRKLASARRVLTQLDKTISLVARVAIFLL
ncbi:MAG: hypothetical protein HKN70_14975 [Gammaproteobacteria bacterium]|nr:hypothetical protein [Gammaproteobacteria bacterium]